MMIEIIQKIKSTKQTLNIWVKKSIKKIMSEDRANSTIEFIIKAKNNPDYFKILIITSLIFITISILNFNNEVYVEPQYSLSDYAYAFRTGARKVGYYKIDNTLSIITSIIGFMSLSLAFLLKPFSILEKIENFIQSRENRKQFDKGNYLTKEQAEELQKEILELKKLYQHKDSYVEK